MIRENREYMLSTNRIPTLVELLIWFLKFKSATQPQFFFGVIFIPQLFEVLTICVKHRVSYHTAGMKELLIEYILCSNLLVKLNQKFSQIEGPLYLTGEQGLVPVILQKAFTFINSLTQIVSYDSRIRPVYDKSDKISESMYFIITATELFNIPNLLTNILIGQGASLVDQLPRSLFSLVVLGVKVLNNLFRINLELVQMNLNQAPVRDIFYGVLNYILKYCYIFQDQDQEVEDLLHETILLIGYYVIMNQTGQNIMIQGENPVVVKLCNLPINYFKDKKLFDILFPTLIALSQNEMILKIIDNEMSVDYLSKYINRQFGFDEMTRIPEDDREHSMGSSSMRSPSIGSTSSSQFSVTIDLMKDNCPFLPLYMRFPRSEWNKCLDIYDKFR